MIAWKPILSPSEFDGLLNQRHFYVPNDAPALDHQELLALLPPFWLGEEQWSDTAQAIYRAHSVLAELLLNELNLIARSAAIETTASCGTTRLLPVIFSEDEITLDGSNYELTLPSYILDAPQIGNSPIDPTVVWDKDEDYEFSGGDIVFPSDPRTSLTPFYLDGSICYCLWLIRPTVSLSDVVSRYFGCFVRPVAEDQSRELSVDLFTRLRWIASLRGNTAEEIVSIALMIYNVPIAWYDGEVVQSVSEQGGVWSVVTDKMVYKFPDTLTPAVVADDVLERGQPLVTGVYVSTANTGQLPDGFESIPVSPAQFAVFLYPYRIAEGDSERLLEDDRDRLSEAAGGFYINSSEYDEVYFQNETVPVTVNGSEISWELSGESESVAAFWQSVRERERMYGVTLYELMLEELGSIPSEINPAQFLVTYFLRSNSLLLAIPPTLYERYRGPISKSRFYEAIPASINVIVCRSTG